MPVLIHCRTVLCAGLTAAGSPWLPKLLRASDLPTGQLAIKNDYNEDIEVAVFHLDALDRHFETWSAVPAEQESALQDKEGKRICGAPSK